MQFRHEEVLHIYEGIFRRVMKIPEGVHFAGRASDKEIGLSMRVVRQYTINNDSIPTRLDVLYGWAPLYPELACRVAA